MEDNRKKAAFRMLLLIATPKLVGKALGMFKEENIPIQYVFHAQGTATSEVMDMLGLDGVDKKEILDLRHQLEQAITARCGEGIVTFTGGATGTCYGYLDFIAWDLRTLLDAAVKVFAGAPVEWAAFHTFRLSADGIGLKQEKEA